MTTTNASNYLLHRIRNILIITVAVLLTRDVSAVDVPDLVTDRPDQTESSLNVPVGSLQIESGATYTDEDEDGQHTRVFEAPSTLLRFGLSERIELRLGIKGWLWDDVSNKDDFGDSDVGMKFYLCAESNWHPEIALLTSLTVPTGGKGFSTERADPSFRFLFGHSLSDRFSIGYNLGAIWETDEDDNGERDSLAVFQYTAAVGFAVNERLGSFVELFGDVPVNAHGTPANSFDAGVTYLLRDNLQFDLSGGVGLSDAADDWFVGFGVSYRLPQ